MRLQVPGIGHSGRGADVPGDPGAKSAASTVTFVELNKQTLEYEVTDMHVICGFKQALPPKEALFPFCVGLLEASFLLVTNRLTLAFSTLLVVTKNIGRHS